MKNLKILLPIRKIDTLILVSTILLLVVLCLINYSDIDLEIQKYFFDFESETWLIDKDEPIKKLIFYQLPKVLFGLGAVACFIAVILGSKSQHYQFFIQNRQRFLLILFGLIFIPLIAGNIKKFTNVYCPAQLEIYAGNKPYVKIFESYPTNFLQVKKGQCFPAGHAVTGFSLMILFFAFAKKSHRFLGIASGVILGWILGFYQMAKGAHFFGDTVVAMILCFIIAATIARIYAARLQKIRN